MNRRDEIKREGQRLEKIARRVWDEVMNQVSPIQYTRTGNSAKAIKLGKPYLQANGRYAIELSWDNGLVYHDSVLGSGQPQGHSVWLISEGWDAPKLRKALGRDIPRFTSYEQSNYLQRVISEYEQGMPTGYSVQKELHGSLKQFAKS